MALKEQQAERYEAEIGAEARSRQEQLAKRFFVCCGTARADGHHESCSLRPADEPTIPATQTSLL